jgi:hypothetical protein
MKVEVTAEISLPADCCEFGGLSVYDTPDGGRKPGANSSFGS